MEEMAMVKESVMASLEMVVIDAMVTLVMQVMVAVVVEELDAKVRTAPALTLDPALPVKLVLMVPTCMTWMEFIMSVELFRAAMKPSTFLKRIQSLYLHQNHTQFPFPFRSHKPPRCIIK